MHHLISFANLPVFHLHPSAHPSAPRRSAVGSLEPPGVLARSARPSSRCRRRAASLADPLGPRDVGGTGRHHGFLENPIKKCDTGLERQTFIEGTGAKDVKNASP